MSGMTAAPPRWRAVGLLLLVALVAAPAARAQQPELGHKTLGTVGVRAGSQVDPGVYLADRLIWYSATDLRNRDGDPIPVSLDLDAVSNGIGVLGVFRLPLSTHLNIAVGVPVTRIRASTVRPEASIDRFGLGDVYVQPARLGWRFARADAVAGYAVYAPTGRFEPSGGEGVGRGQWSHEISAGGTVYFDAARTWSLSALGSWDINQRKRGIDITRGDTVQIQGGIGKILLHFLEPGLTGYALWQVTDDTGEDLPAAVRGARDHAIGLGAHLGVLLPPIRGRVSVSWSHDLVVRTRPLGQVLVLGLTVAAWKPAPE